MDTIDMLFLRWETVNIIATTALLMLGFAILAMMRLILP